MKNICGMNLDEKMIKLNYFFTILGKVFGITAIFFLIFKLLQFKR